MTMKKLCSFALVIAMILALAACGGGSAPAQNQPSGEAPAQNQPSGEAPAQNQPSGEAPAQSDAGSVLGANIAFIVPADDALGINDKGWIQKTWEGVKNYGDANGKTYTWYRPNDNSTQGYLNAMATAINSGTEVIVNLGFQSVEALSVAQHEYPDIYFISTECNGVENDMADNHYAIFHQTDEAGFLAGVAAVKGGFKNIGIITGLDIPPMNIWTWGYIQGINYTAAKEGITDITLRHTYVNTSAASPEVQTLAASWYADGVDLIMCMVAGGNNSVFAAANAAGKACFGADVDQGGESEFVLTCPIKRLELTVSEAVSTVYDGTFRGGTYKWFNVDDNAVGLATDNWRVPNYSVADYQKDFDNFKNDVDGVRSGIITQDTAPSVDDLWNAITDKNITFNNIK